MCVSPVKTGNIWYGNYENILKATDTAKELLNGGDEDYNIWAKVQINATYGDCEREFADLNNRFVQVDFRKPIVIKSNDNNNFWFDQKDTDDVNVLPIWSMFTITDSWNNKIVSINPTTKKLVIDDALYGYYKIEFDPCIHFLERIYIGDKACLYSRFVHGADVAHVER